MMRRIRSFAALFSVATLAGCGGDSAPARDTGGGTTAVAAEEISLDSDGWALRGSYRSANRHAVTPAALLLHRAAGSRTELTALAEALAQRRVSSLALDLRGHGESVNRGRFEAPFAENLHINEGVHRDVIAALDWLAMRTDVDASRLAVVGGSYSGEAAGLALREGARPAVAYVMLSPGNFSDASIAAARASSARWLFVRSLEEGPASKPHIDALFELLETDAPSLERWVLEGAGHASELFTGRPEFVDDLADWIAAAVDRRPGQS
jgi:dienelactone hydrolase